MPGCVVASRTATSHWNSSLTIAYIEGNSRISQSLRYGLDEKALDCVREWLVAWPNTFDSSENDTVQATLYVKFELSGSESDPEGLSEEGSPRGHPRG